MNIEELSKAQLILLTILVNFVTSVATGILTVSLLDQAPPVVTQTINRVVDHTIERVVETVPAVKPSSPAPSNQDLVTAAIAASAARAVTIYSVGASTSTPAIALGTYLPDARAIVTAAQDALPKEVVVMFSNDARVAASLSHKGNGIMIYGFSDAAVLPKLAVPRRIISADLKLGQTALAVTADGSAANGIISRVGSAGIRTTLPDIGAGSAAVSITGDFIGIAAGSTAPGLLIPTETITTLLASTSTPSS